MVETPLKRRSLLKKPKSASEHGLIDIDLKEIFESPLKRRKQNHPTASPAKIVQFNVGGKTYQVSRSLLEQHPNIMLAKSASEHWLKDPESEIFIERDGDVFAHVLDYLRDGRVLLPATVCKGRLLLELEFFGVENVGDDSREDERENGGQTQFLFGEDGQNLQCIT